MNRPGRMPPGKMLLSVITVAAVTIASAWGAFHMAQTGGMLNAKVRVMGNVEGFNATQCFLYVDGVKSGTQYLDYEPPPVYSPSPYYYGYDFEFIVNVAANAQHEFTVTTSDGEGSNTETVYTPYGQNTNVFLNIYAETTQITVKGNYTGDNPNPSVDFYIDGNPRDTVYGSNPDHLEYEFSETVYSKQEHVFMVRLCCYPEGALSNQTTVYVGADPVTIYLDLKAILEVPEVKMVSIDILGNYEGKDGTYQVDLLVDDVYAEHDYVVNPGYTDYSFSVEVNESQTYVFKLVLKDETHQYLASNLSTIIVGTEPLTIYMDLLGPETVTVTVKGNYTGNYTECRVYLYADGEEFWRGIINPGCTNYTFEFEVYTCVYHHFALQVRDLDGNYICGHTLHPYIGTEPVTFYINLDENDY